MNHFDHTINWRIPTGEDRARRSHRERFTLESSTSRGLSCRAPPLHALGSRVSWRSGRHAASPRPLSSSRRGGGGALPSRPAWARCRSTDRPSAQPIGTVSILYPRLDVGNIVPLERAETRRRARAARCRRSPRVILAFWLSTKPPEEAAPLATTSRRQSWRCAHPRASEGRPADRDEVPRCSIARNMDPRDPESSVPRFPALRSRSAHYRTCVLGPTFSSGHLCRDRPEPSGWSVRAPGMRFPFDVPR